MKKKNKELLMIVQYPENVAPSQRFRVEIYKDTLKQNGFTVRTKFFIDQTVYAVIYRNRFSFAKSIALLKGFLMPFILISSIRKYGFILLQREATTTGP